MKNHHSITPSLLFLSLASLLSISSLSAQTSGQNVIDKKNADAGFTREAFTLGNSKLIGRTAAGVLGPITLGTGLSLSGSTLNSSATSTLATLTDVTLTSLASGDFLKYNGSAWINRTAANVRSDLGLVIGTNVQAYDAELAAIAALANAGGLLHNNGAGGFSYYGVSTGMLGVPDAGMIPLFGGNGDLSATSTITLADEALAGGGIILESTIANGQRIVLTDGTNVVNILSPATPGNYDIRLPSNTGTLLSTASSIDAQLLTGILPALNAAALTTLSADAITSGTLLVARGGSGRTSATAYAVLCGGTTSTGAHQSIASVGTSGQVLTSNGASALPTFQTLSTGITIGTTAIISGTGGRVLYETSGNKAGEISGATSDGTTLTLVAPVLGTPASGTLTNCTGLPAASVVAGTVGPGVFKFGNSTSDYIAIVANPTQPREIRIGSNYASLGDQSYYIMPYASGSINTNANWYLGGATVAITCQLMLYDRILNNAQTTFMYFGTAELQMGADTNGDAVDQTIKAADGITGTDKNGGDLTLASGNSTGTGTSDVIVSTPAAGSTGTTARTAAERLRVNSTTVSASVPIKLPSYTVAGLPSASTCGAGSMAFVTDANTTSILGLGTTVVGGGSNKVPVISDGTNWIIH